MERRRKGFSGSQWAIMGQVPDVRVNPFPIKQQPSTSGHVHQTTVRNPQPASTATAPPLQRQTRRTRYKTRPLAPLDEARRILKQVELQKAAADAEKARAFHLIAQNLGRLADAVENLARARIGNDTHERIRTRSSGLQSGARTTTPKRSSSYYY